LSAGSGSIATGQAASADRRSMTARIGVAVPVATLQTRRVFVP
jgi:hypothetical protein